MAIEIRNSAFSKPSFEAGSLVASESSVGEKTNVYLVIGPGVNEETFAAVRLYGRGSFGYSENILRSLVTHFEGEVVIKNG